jgi:nucleotide-binding universal stress UspA family protein
MFQRVLIATDLGPASAPAVEKGFALARRLGAQVVLLYVAERPYEAHPWFEPVSRERPLFADVVERQQVEARNRIDQLVADLRRGGAAEGVRLEAVVTAGVAAERIIEEAGRRDCDLIVIGTHGRVGVKHALLGSVAERVARGAAQPVLIVRGNPG